MSVLLKQDEIYFRINEQTNCLEYSTNQKDWYFKCEEELIMETLDNLTSNGKNFVSIPDNLEIDS